MGLNMAFRPECRYADQLVGTEPLGRQQSDHGVKREDAELREQRPRGHACSSHPIDFGS